ncbi:PulJ/GspJ family protein, partial [Thalassolituus sp. UBA2590]
MISRGFTLLEVLVAVAISATVGIAAVQLLSNISGVNKASIEKADDL